MFEGMVLILVLTTIYLFTQIGALKNNIKELKEIQKCLLERLNKNDINDSSTTPAKTEPKANINTPQDEKAELSGDKINTETNIEIIIDKVEFSKTEEFSNKEKAPFETFFAGNILNKVGAITFILGIGFFLKYAFNNNWINEYMQITLGYLIGAAIVWFAYKQQKDEIYKIFSQGLAGIGCAILYLVTYCAYNFYNIVPYLFSFILMIGTTILTFYTAYRFNSFVVAFIGIIGGYLTPFILPGESNSSFGLLSYLIFLSILVSAFIYKKAEWKFIETFSHSANLIIMLYTINLLNQSRIESFLMVLIIFSCYFIRNFFEFKRKATVRPLNTLINIGASIFVCYTISYQLLNHFGNSITALTAFCFAIIHFIPPYLAHKNNWAFQNINKLYIVISILLVFIATAILTDGFTNIILWTIEAFIVLYIGAKTNKAYLIKTALSILALTATGLLGAKGAINYKPLAEFTPILNLRFLAFATLITLSILGVELIKKTQGAADKFSFHINTLRVMWTTALFVLATVEINDLNLKLLSTASTNMKEIIKYNKAIIFGVLWAIYGARLVSYGINRAVLYFGYFVYFLSIIALLRYGFYFVPLDAFIPILNIRALGWLSTCAAALTLSYWNTKLKIKNLFRYLFCILLFLFINTEVKTYFNLINNSDMEKLTFSIVWLLFSFTLMSIGIWKKIRPFRYFAMGVISIAILKIFLIDLAFLNEFHRIISFICLGIILLGSSYIYHRYNKLIIENIKEEHQQTKIESKE